MPDQDTNRMDVVEEALTRACADFGLTAIGANLFDTKTNAITVYVHWDATDVTCASGTGKTFYEALACAVAEMGERRASPTPRGDHQ